MVILITQVEIHNYTDAVLRNNTGIAAVLKFVAVNQRYTEERQHQVEEVALTNSQLLLETTIHTDALHIQHQNVVRAVTVHLRERLHQLVLHTVVQVEVLRLVLRRVVQTQTLDTDVKLNKRIFQ